MGSIAVERRKRLRSSKAQFSNDSGKETPSSGLGESPKSSIRELSEEGVQEPSIHNSGEQMEENAEERPSGCEKEKDAVNANLESAKDDADAAALGSASEGDMEPGAAQEVERETEEVEKKAKLRKSGVVYLSRIPPGMDIGALRSLLSRVGRLGRVWLRPESAASLAERRSLTGARRRTEFRDGWAEFKRRRDARRAVDLLNGQPMAGVKRRGRWADDLWCMRYLSGFSWANLVEETCSGARERTLRVKAEVAAARRERAFVEDRVAMANRLERDEEAQKKPVRRFRQKRAIGEREWEEDVDERRAREAAERVDQEVQTGKGRRLDDELVSMLFKKRKKNAGEPGNVAKG